MHAIVMKYFQLVCIAVLFENVNCEQLSLENSKDDYLLNRAIGCTAICMKDNPNQVLEECYRKCSNNANNMDETIKLKYKDKNATMQVLCRDDDGLVVQILNNVGNDQTGRDAHQTNKSQLTDLKMNQSKDNADIYLVKIQETENMFSQKIVYITNSSLVYINNLASNTSYNITAAIFTDNLEFSFVNVMTTVSTLKHDYEPGEIKNDSIFLSEMILNESEGTFDIEIGWRPADDMTCHYDFLYFPLDEKSELRHLELRKPEQLYRSVAMNVPFGSAFHVGIKGVNTKNKHLESAHLNWVEFKTPTCLDYFNYDLNNCAPPESENITAHSVRIGEHDYNVNVTWLQSTWTPDYYIVKLLEIDPHKQQYLPIRTMNVSGNSSNAYFPEVKIMGLDYDVNVTAYSRGGATSTVIGTDVHGLYMLAWGEYKTIKSFIIHVLMPVLLALIMALLILIYLCRRMKRNRLSDDHMMYQTKEVFLKELTQKYNNDEMEVNPDRVRLYDVLGEGAFGVVRKGVALPEAQDVAVKMLKDNATLDDLKAFLREISLMKSVGRHQNIVGIVGHCTTVVEKMMLLTEYCSEGNLLNYLRNAWRQLSTAQNISNPVNEKDSLKKRIPDSPKTNSSSSEKKSTVTGIRSLIINKLYANCNADNNNSKAKGKSCVNSCKCQVEILTKDLNDINADADFQRKCTIRIKDCDCGIKSRRDTPSTISLFAENHGYEAFPASDCNTNPEQIQQNESIASNKSTRGKQITSVDLLMFAKQIAKGMEFLSTNKIVHRDLAARNVLVCADKTVKIADFGLSRDIYQDNIYMKCSAGRLPIKWLALESMVHQHYTTQSDVWSYGILLYEIVTLGDTPYPTVPVDCLVTYLKSGNRMVKPMNCNSEFYDLMSACWHYRPEKRPTFLEISKKLDHLINSSVLNDVIDINCVLEHRAIGANGEAGNTSTTSYLKPL